MGIQRDGITVKNYKDKIKTVTGNLATTGDDIQSLFDFGLGQWTEHSNGTPLRDIAQAFIGNPRLNTATAIAWLDSAKGLRCFRKGNDIRVIKDKSYDGEFEAPAGKWYDFQVNDTPTAKDVDILKSLGDLKKKLGKDSLTLAEGNSQAMLSLALELLGNAENAVKATQVREMQERERGEAETIREHNEQNEVNDPAVFVGPRPIARSVA